MYLKFVVKEPGRGVRLLPAELELSQRWHQDQARKAAAGEAPRRAFERLLLDAMLGDQSNFIREDEMARLGLLACFASRPPHRSALAAAHTRAQR